MPEISANVPERDETPRRGKGTGRHERRKSVVGCGWCGGAAGRGGAGCGREFIGMCKKFM